MEPVRIEFLMVDKLSGRLDQATGKMEQLTGQTSQARERMEELDRSGLSVQKTLGRLASAFALKELVGKITAVRGEFQQLEVAFETMLGSAEKADALLGQLTRTAATTPFGLEDVAQGAKQLLAYGFEAEKVNETLVRLGDIAAGLSVPLNDLVYLYGTTMAQGRLYTQDLNQFTGRGIPMISELAKQFGVAESKVKELVEAGKVGFPEVQKVIESLTDEGGKFGGLMEAQSKTISGQISNIEDALSMMFNELGQRSEGIINKTLSGVSYMVEHYEQFGRILLGLVGTYGVYKTAVMTVTAAKGFATAAEMAHYNLLLLVEKAQKALNATMLGNPYVLVATAVAGVAAAMMSMKTEAERLKDAEEDYEAQKQKVIEAEEEHRRRIEELCSIAGDEAVSTDTRREALNKLEQKYPDIFAKYDTEYEKLKNIKKIKEEIALQDGQKSITKTENELERVEKRIKALEGKTRTATEHYQDGYGRWTTRYVTKSARTKDEEAELKNLYAKRKQLSGSDTEDVEGSIRERGEAYAADRSQISNIIKDVETLNWLVKKGYAKPTSVSVWEAQSAALEKYMKDQDAEAAANDALWEKVQGSTGYYEWGNSLNGGSNEWSLRGYSKEQIELLYNQNKLSKEARDYYEAWVDSGKSVEELNQHIVECMDSMREMVMGVSFDSFLSSSRDVLKQMRSDISALGEFTEETLSEAILNAFMYQELAKDLEPLYNDLSEHLINGTADKEYLENWRRTYEETMTAANARLDAISEATGVDISDDKGTSQSAKAGGFQAMTQDQGSKLEGMFTSGLQHWSSMDEKMENVAQKMNAAENHLAKIEENTGKSADKLEKIAENMVVILRDGLKVK